MKCSHLNKLVTFSIDPAETYWRCRDCGVSSTEGADPLASIVFAVVMGIVSVFGGALLLLLGGAS